MTHALKCVHREWTWIQLTLTSIFSTMIQENSSGISIGHRTFKDVIVAILCILVIKWRVTCQGEFGPKVRASPSHNVVDYLDLYDAQSMRCLCQLLPMVPCLFQFMIPPPHPRFQQGLLRLVVAQRLASLLFGRLPLLLSMVHMRSGTGTTCFTGVQSVRNGQRLTIP